jgi:RimJ/RimL family protein N-acetyltransferase
MEEPPSPPPLEGRHTTLRPVSPSDYEWLYAIASSQGTGASWRLRGGHINPDQFIALLWADSELLFTVRRRSTQEPVGMIQLTQCNHKNGTGHMTSFLAPAYTKRIWPAEGFLLFVNYAFQTFPLRKLYIEAIEPALKQFESLSGSILEEEGRLRDHEFFDGSYVDYIILALYRDAWNRVRPPFLDGQR